MSYDEPERIVKSLDDWLFMKKNEIYDENIKTIEGTNNDLAKYIHSLEGLAFILIRAIEKEELDKLESMGFPNDLSSCVNDTSCNLIIIDRIKQWFVRHPFSKSRHHMNELAKENVGLE
jgi:hypothetical protein